MSTTPGEHSPFATEAELEWAAMGPFDGGVPGMVRRIRRILDVSQRGLAAILGVSQSVVARWESGRTSPRVSVLSRLFEMVRLRVTISSEETGEMVEPMRDDGARTRAGARFPAHTDLRATSWWVPAGVETTMTQYYTWQSRSRSRREPMIRARTCPHLRRQERLFFGTPADHPSTRQLAAEVEHLDECREQRRYEARASARLASLEARRPGSQTTQTTGWRRPRSTGDGPRPAGETPWAPC